MRPQPFAYDCRPCDNIRVRCPLELDSPQRCVLSIDLEDWQQSVLDSSLPVSRRFLIGMHRLLELLDVSSARATIFSLGNVARAHPSFLRRLHDAGHEVQSHGYAHQSVRTMSPRQFRHDVLASKCAIEDAIGAPVTGFRAPRFSIDRDNLWALDVLADCGFAYDSSIFPMRVRGYGIRDWPAGPADVHTNGGSIIREMPVSVGEFGRLRVPVGGGGYLRLLPGRLMLAAVRQVHRRGLPFVLYVHPHELDPHAFRDSPYRIPLGTRMHQGIRRASVAGKLAAMLGQFRWTRFADLDHTCHQRVHLPAHAAAEVKASRRSSAHVVT